MPHTPAPWKVGKLTRGNWDQWDITAEIAGMRVALAATPGGNGNDSSNARRIVACVNACEGITDDALETYMERGGIAKAWARDRDNYGLAERDALKARERDLVEALEQFLDADVTGHLAPEGREAALHQARAKARTLLAKARP